MKTKTKKPFDCVEMKRKGSAEVLRAIGGMSLAQERDFWRRQSLVLTKILEEARKPPKKKK